MRSPSVTGKSFRMASEDGFQLWILNPNFFPDIPGAEPFQAMGESGGRDEI